MSVNLSGRSFLKLLDFTPEEITYLVDLSEELKRKKAREFHVLSRNIHEVGETPLSDEELLRRERRFNSERIRYAREGEEIEI